MTSSVRFCLSRQSGYTNYGTFGGVCFVVCVVFFRGGRREGERERERERESMFAIKSERDG